VLGVSADADQATVKKAYRERVKEAHPDTETGSEEEFKRVNKAYERLSE
jgi:curved DNA-binding protein CbpA